MELEFEISKQKLIRKDTTEIVNQSVKYVTCEFTFKTSEWQGADKYAIFKSEDKKNYCIPLGSECTGTCNVPGKVLEHDFFRLTIFGILNDERITTTEQTIILIRSGFTSELHPYDSDESGDIFSQLMEVINNLIDDVVYSDGYLHFYKDNAIFKSIDVRSDIWAELVEYVGQLQLDFEEMSTVNENIELEIKKGYRLLEAKIRTYGA